MPINKLTSCNKLFLITKKLLFNLLLINYSDPRLDLIHRAFSHTLI